MHISESKPVRSKKDSATHGLPAIDASGSRGICRPAGRVTAGELADLVCTVLVQARDQDLQELVVNIVRMTGFSSPGPAYRRWVARRWAEAAGGALRVAFVARAEHICPHKTGLLVAAEEGLEAYICLTEAEAVAWLER